MYENYFGFIDLPFRVTPERQYLYSNPAYQQAFAALHDGIDGRRGLIVVTGEIGTGKTMLMTAFIHQSETSGLRTAWVLNPTVTFAVLLKCALQDLDIVPASEDAPELIRQLRDFARQEARDGRNVALFIDEAQILDSEVFRQLELLLDSERDGGSSLQIVLLGQPELEDKLENPHLGSLKERVSIHIRLTPLAVHEVAPYVHWRLAKAGYRGRPLFEEQAIARVALYSAGIPRLINIICDNALLIGFALSKKTISPSIIDEVADDLLVSGPPRPEENIALDPPSDTLEPAEQVADRLPRAAGFSSRAWGDTHAEIAIVAFSAVFLLVLGWFLRDGSDALNRNTVSLYPVPAESLISLETRPDEPAQAAPRKRGADGAQWDSGQRKSEASRTPPNDQNSDSSARPGFTKQQSEIRLRGTPAPAGNFAGERIDIRAPAKSPAAVQVLDQAGAERPRNVSLTSGQQEPRPRPRAAPPRYWGDDRMPPRRTQKAGSERDFFRGTFEVTADSLLFDEPAHQSALLKTLRPGLRVRVENKVGNFLAVRSLDDPGIEGYVHLDDAFFRRINLQSAGRE